MKRKRKNFDILFFERLLAENPNFAQALSCLGDELTRKGFYKEGLEIDKRLMRLKPHDPIVHYNLACSFSLMGDVKKSLFHLKKAVLFGYDEFSYMLKDSDLERVRRSPGFKTFVKKIKKITNTTRVL